MLLEKGKRQLPSTSESFYTPSKGKNPSSIETNPSSNVVNSLSPINLVSPSPNMSSVPSYSYSNIQLSQSLNTSPSFMSPNREIGSILTTPDKSSIQFQFKSYPREFKKKESDFMLKTESCIKVNICDDISQSEKSFKSKNVPKSQIKDFMKLLEKFRAQKIKKQAISRQMNHQTSKHKYLTKIINEKEEKLIDHKNEVEKKVEKKNALMKKIKMKKMRIKTQQNDQLSRLRTKSSMMSEEFYITQRKIELETRHIEILQRQRQSYQQMLRQRSISQQFYPQNYQVPFSFVQHPSQQYQYHSFGFQNPEQQFKGQLINSSQYSSTKKVHWKEPPNSSQPNSSRSKSDFNKKSNKNSQKPQLNIMEVLRSHFAKQSNQNNLQAHDQRNQKMKNSKNDSLSVKRALQEMIETVSDNQGSRRPSIHQRDKSETQSQIEIDCESLANFSDCKMMESNIYSGRKKRSVDHSPKSRDLTNQSDKKFGGAAKEFIQSLVNIICDSSQFSDNIYRNHEFVSPRLQDQENQKRKRSPTQQVSYKSKFLTVDTGNSETRLKGSQRKGGDQTPAFRSSNKDSEHEIIFSRMLLASIRNQNQQELQLGSSQTNVSIMPEKIPQNELIRIQEDLKFSDRNKRDRQAAFKTIHNESTEQIQIIDEDDEFFNCTLNTESKIIAGQKVDKETILEKKTSKSMKIPLEEQQEFDELSKTSNSYIQKLGSEKKKVKHQEKRSSLDLTSKSKISPNFEAVLELDEAFEQDAKSLINKKVETTRRSSKATL